MTVRNKLVCEGTLRPTATSDSYTVRLEQRNSGRPRVSVLRPELQLALGKARLPHVFEENDLCLHLPGDWHSYLRIADWIIPWASLWLFFYEVWLRTGEWLGGGHEPNGAR